MDYLDPQKQLQHRIILFVGYGLMAIAISVATVVLLYLAYGFGIGKNGTVIQNGLIFVSSTPTPAQIYLNGQLSQSKTDARLVVPAGVYQLQLRRNGYRPWQRAVTLDGGSVQHFDYPFLIPLSLVTQKIEAYATPASFVTQSPDLRWLLVAPSSDGITFDEYDLKSTNPKLAPINIPTTLLTKASTSQSWQVIEWSDDNQHLLLAHHYDAKTEFIVLDLKNPDQSVNLNKLFGFEPTAVSLVNKKYDSYYLYNAATQSLETASLQSPAPVAYLEHVLAYKSYGNNTLIYISNDSVISGKVDIKMAVGSNNYLLRSLTAASNYLVNLTQYNGVLYVVAGSPTANKVYIYKDPIGQLTAQPSQLPQPLRTLQMPADSYLSFSPNARFILTENGSRVAIYDIETSKSYYASLSLPIDSPATNVGWMDGYHLNYVSQGKLVILDYDNTNQQILEDTSPAYSAFFSPDYKYVYSMAPQTGQPSFSLNQTALRIPADL
ncbi:MAG TPA: PEGA domain-containing protein [Candidatus Dormibacteraeota bacterium]|nr:PEGA domain-containing protein [Candidatus Dormibacteraeota bacterium]